jgi:hypothetical protein
MTGPVHARAAGKTAMRARIVWQLEAGSLVVRCVRSSDGFVVQARTEKGWTEVVAEGTSAYSLLASCATSGAVYAALYAALNEEG